MRLLLFFALLVWRIAALSQDSISINSSTAGLTRYSIFLKGEYHERRAENERSFLLLAKHLYSHNNVRYLVFEWGPDFTYLANRYLLTGNDSLLFNNTLYFSKAFWDAVALLNRTKSDANKIKIAGFDFNRSILTAKAFSEMLKGKEAIPDSAIQANVENIIAWKDKVWTWNGQKEFATQMKELRLQCKRQDTALVAYFGDDWRSFLAIVNHDVESTPMVKRDKMSIGYVTEFLAKKDEGNVLFNLGVNHTYFDGAGMGNLLQQDVRYRDKVCSIYPYHRIPDVQKEKYQQEQDKNLPASLVAELQTAAAYSLFNLAEKGLYPEAYRKTQCVYVIPQVNKP